MEESAPGSIAWPPPGLPHDARVFQLRANSKAAGSDKAHWRARPVSQALVVITESFSYGLALDDPENQRCDWLLADLDNINDPQARAAFDALPDTWMQQTAAGKLHKVFETPHDAEFFNRYHNVKWRLPDGTLVGDLKIHGYAAAPGSTVNGKRYARLNDLQPVLAPPELLALLAVAPEPVATNSVSHIPVGERDIAMTQIAGWLRRKGWDEQAMVKALYAIARSGVVEQPPTNEWILADAQRVARSIVQKPPEEIIGRLVPEALICGADVRLVKAPRRWLIPNFIAQGEFSMLYGDGECGKSTFLARLAADASARNLRVLYFGVEEPFDRFVFKARLCGAERRLLYAPRGNASIFKFPRYAEDLASVIDLTGLDLVLFDSLTSHMVNEPGANMADRDRHCLSSIAEIPATSVAVRTIVGVFHENRSGDWSGSAERKNVPRCLLHAQRDTASDEPMTLLVEKANNFTKPRYVATYVGRQVLATDPETGQTQMEEDENGKLVPSTITIVERSEDKPIGKKGKGKSKKVTGSVNLADVGEIDPPLL